MSRQPITAMYQHLSWTESGTVWATYRLQGLAYGRRPVKDKHVVKTLHRALIRAIKGEALLLGLSVSVAPAAVVQSMIEGVNLGMCPMWAEEGLANLERLDEIALGERVYYVAVPLANQGRSALVSPLKASIRSIKDTLGMPVARPSDIEIQTRLAQAQRVLEAIPSNFRPTAVNEAEQVWIASRHQSRGLLSFLPEAEMELNPLVTSSGVALPSAYVDEGCISELEDRRDFNPLKRRVMKVSNPAREDQPASYQSMLVMSSTPMGGVTFPGSELFERIDEIGPEVDWAIRVRINSRDAVMKANRKAVRELNDQFEQREEETSMGAHDLEAAAELLREYESIFAADRLEVEVEHTIILAVGADTYEEADRQALQVQSVLGADDFEFQRPVGDQERLWSAMHVGSVAGPIVHAYSHPTTSDQFAMLVPFTTTKIGGKKGPVFALNTSNARMSAVHIDPGGYPELDMSGAMVFTGELGAGKSYAMKTTVAHQVAMGADVCAIDKSGDGEWAHFITSLIDDFVVVDPENLTCSMDPLRIMGDPKASAEVAKAFYTTLLNVSPRENDGITLFQVLQADYLTQHDISSSEALMNHLADGCELNHAKDLAQQLQNYARTSLGRIVLDESLPPVDVMHAGAIVWRTHTMEQPTAEDMSQPHLFRNLTLEKIFGRAYYRLVMSTARKRCFADRSRVSLFVGDEAYDLNLNPENQKDAEHFIRQGRRPKAIFITGSHDPDNDWSETARKLIPTRIVMRQTDPDLAEANIRFLGVPQDDPAFADMVEILRRDTSPVQDDRGVPPERRGECFIRDAFGTIGEARVLGPAQEHLAQAVRSTPPKSKTAVS